MKRRKLRKRLWKGAANVALWTWRKPGRRLIWHGGFPRLDPPGNYWYAAWHGWDVLRQDPDIMGRLGWVGLG